MTKKNEKRKPFFANINEDEFDLLTRFEGKYLIRVRAFSAMNLYMTYTHKQLAVEWGCDERTVRTARVGLIKKGLCALVNDGKRQYLAPTSKGGCGSFRSAQEGESGSFRSADQSDPDHFDPRCGSFRSATADQNDPNALYIKKECIKRNVLREREEGLTPQVASLTSPSAHCVSDLAQSSAISSTREIQTQVQNPPFVSDPTALEALVDQLVAKKLAEASKSDENLPALTESRVDQKKAKEKALRPSDGRYRAYNEADFFFPDSWSGLGRDAMARWVDHKNKIKKPLFQESYQQLLKNHVSNETLFVLSVNKSIAAGYQGLIPPDRNELQEHTRNLNAERLANDQVSPALAAFMKGMTNNG
jgi:hypothetical protein